MAKIVVLEDDASTRLVICGVLKKSGHEVLGVDNGAEGLLIILAEQPDLVISDVQMPKLSGLEVLAQMRQNEDLSDTPLILLTALDSRADMRAGMSQGASDYISKPFEPQELIESVNAQLAQLEQRKSKMDTRAQELAASKVAQLRQGQSQGNGPQDAPATALSGVASPPAPLVQVPLAWIVHVAVHNPAMLIKRMDPKDWRLLLRNLYSPRGAESALRTASHVDFSGNNLTVVFADTVGQAESAAVRAARAVADMVAAAGTCKRWMTTHFAGQDMPAFKAMVNLHAGPVSIAKVPLGAGIAGTKDQVVGTNIDMACNLRNAEPPVMWAVLATEAALSCAPENYRAGAHQNVALGVQETRVHALLGLDTRLVSHELSPADWL